MQIIVGCSQARRMVGSTKTIKQFRKLSSVFVAPDVFRHIVARNHHSIEHIHITVFTYDIPFNDLMLKDESVVVTAIGTCHNLEILVTDAHVFQVLLQKMNHRFGGIVF